MGAAERGGLTFLNPVTGWNLTAEQVNDIGRRVSQLARVVSLRHGFTPIRDSGLPQRAFDEPVTNKYGTRSVWTREEWEPARRRHYERIGLSERGLPKRADLEQLGLGFTVPELQPLGALD